MLKWVFWIRLLRDGRQLRTKFYTQYRWNTWPQCCRDICFIFWKLLLYFLIKVLLTLITGANKVVSTIWPWACFTSHVVYGLLALQRTLGRWCCEQWPLAHMQVTKPCTSPPTVLESDLRSVCSYSVRVVQAIVRWQIFTEQDWLLGCGAVESSKTVSIFRWKVYPPYLRKGVTQEILMQRTSR
jgi:hypothetical protein